jgi:FAD binding domain
MTTRKRSLLSDLRAELTEPVIGPADPGYDKARAVFLPTIDRRPVAIARPVDAAEVAAVVAFARERELELAVRGGGHSSAGHGVSEGARVASAQAGPDGRRGHLGRRGPWARDPVR